MARVKLSGTLALRDSRVGLKQNQISLEQNNAIQALTYLTIGYLPLGLISVSYTLSRASHGATSSLNRIARLYSQSPRNRMSCSCRWEGGGSLVPSSSCLWRLTPSSPGLITLLISSSFPRPSLARPSLPRPSLPALLMVVGRNNGQIYGNCWVVFVSDIPRNR